MVIREVVLKSKYNFLSPNQTLSRDQKADLLSGCLGVRSGRVRVRPVPAVTPHLSFSLVFLLLLIGDLHFLCFARRSALRVFVGAAFAREKLRLWCGLLSFGAAARCVVLSLP